MKASTRSLAWVLFAAPLVLASCGGVSEDGEDVGAIEQQLPAGSNAQVVSNTIPLALNPGERRYVTAVMRNTGASSATNTWDSTYSLSRVSTVWSWVSTPVAGTVAPNNNASFGFVITAPAAGTYSFTARMKQDVQFGSTLTVPNIVVSNATTRAWSCTYEPGSSTIPATMAPGENRSVTVTVRNTGTQAWTSSGFYLKSQDSPAGLWNNTSNALTTNVAPGATTSFSLGIKAPSTPGTYSLKRQMLDGNVTGVGFFDLNNPCVNVSITVGGSSPLNATVASQNFPTTMAPGETRIITVSMTNTGTQTWTTGGSFGLYSKNTPTSLWGVTQALVTSTTAQNANATVGLVITAPTTPGAYAHAWQMRKTTGADAGFFGQLINIPVTVDANAQAQYGATVLAQNIPAKVTAGKTYSFQVTMQNSGSTSWSGSSFALYTTNSPASLWTATSAALGSAETVASAASRVFTLNAKAPAAPGNYDSRWRMRYLGGIGFFGEEAVTSPVAVTLCGNNIINAGETCDDNNLTDGDGCSSDCLLETTTVVDLASAAAGRTLVGTQNSRQLSPVAIGDVTNDGTPDVVVGENATVSGRNQAGAVYGYSGGASFLNGQTTSASASPTFKVIGAEALDGLGTLGFGSIVIGDVTGDAVQDLVLSASGADGASNARNLAGEVYVLNGSLTGTIDLAAAPAALKATIIGAHAGDFIAALGVADLTGDGVNDLIVGAIGDDTTATDAGAIYVIKGGSAITGTIDLLSPPVGVSVYRIAGEVANDQVGSAMAVGNFGGSSANDIVIGAANSSPSARSEAGSAYAVFGPIGANVSLATAVGAAGGPAVKWIGAGANDKLGVSVAVGNVTGTSTSDVVIGAIQQRKGGLQFGAANVWAGPLASGTTYDLSASGGQTATIQGRDQYDDLGSAIRLGDWTGDGYLDIAVAAYAGDGPLNDRDGAGEITIVRGSATLSGTIDLATYAPLFIGYGAGSRDLLGARQTALAFGNINADGKADFCVGSQKGGTNGSLLTPGRVDCFAAP